MDNHPLAHLIPKDGGIYRVNGKQMRCIVLGEGKPLLLCHGFLSSAEEFGGRFLELAQTHQLIIPDLPGNGMSATLTGHHTVDAMAQSMKDLLDVLHIDEFDVAGLCLGASVACAVSRMCEGRVGKMVLHTPLVAPALIRPFYRRQVNILTHAPFWQLVVALSRNRTASDVYKKYIIREGNVDPETKRINFENQVRANSNAARQWLRDGSRHDDLKALLSRADATLVIVAEHDQMIDIEQLKTLLYNRPHIQLFIDTEQGHGWNNEAVHRQLNVMQEFLANS